MIKVCDAIMGSGKSSAAINYMNEHPNKKFIYITPYEDETWRIKKSCSRANFFVPFKSAEYKWSKTCHIAALIKEGKNIASTHQAFKYYKSDMIDDIRNSGYTLIIDEDLEVFDKDRISRKDLEYFASKGIIKDDGDYFSYIDSDYDGEMLKDLLRLLKSRNLYKLSEPTKNHYDLYYWTIPPELLMAFEDVFVLTYLFEGQCLSRYFEMYDLEYKKIGISYDNGYYRFSEDVDYIPPYVRELHNKIHIFENYKLNQIGKNRCSLSNNWYNLNPDNVAQLKNNTYNYFCNYFKNVPAEYRMYGTFKSKKAKIGGKGYTKGFVVFNKKATNEYKNKRVLAYCVNVFADGAEKNFFYKNNVQFNEDLYALSTMIQWIWRSAIREGKEIWIYIPSKRMRTLLINWIKETEENYKIHIKGDNN